MADLTHSSWSQIDQNNTSPSPDGIQGGYAPSTVGPILRSMRGATKRFFDMANAIYTTTGSANAYVLTFEQAPAAYTKGVIIHFYASFANTGAATLNINGLGVKALMVKGVALTANQIASGDLVRVAYDGTGFQVLSNVTQDLKLTGSLALAGNLSVTGNTALTGVLSLTGAFSGSTATLTGALNGNTATFTSTVTAALFSGSGASLTNLNASNLATGTIADARLPATLSQKVFTGPIVAQNQMYIDNAGDKNLYLRNSDGSQTTAQFISSPTGNVHTTYLRTWNWGSTAFRDLVMRQDGTITWGGNPVFHGGNDGVGSGLDADLLDGQQGAFYQNASNLSAGTIADARLPTSMANKSFTGTLGIPSTGGTNVIVAGAGDAANYTTQNFILQGWYGMGMRTYDGSINGYYDFRAGKWDTKGGFFKNGVEAFYSSGGTVTGNFAANGAVASNAGRFVGNDGNGWLILYPATNGTVALRPNNGATSSEFKADTNGIWWNNQAVARSDGGTYSFNITGTAGRAYPRRTDGGDLNFNWSGQGGQPTWLWGGSDGTNMYVYNPSNFNVNYANNAGAVGGVGLGGLAQFSTSGNQSETNFPIGQTLSVVIRSATSGRRELNPVYLRGDNTQQYTINYGTKGAQLAGGWRQCGWQNDDAHLYQRMY